MGYPRSIKVDRVVSGADIADEVERHVLAGLRSGEGQGADARLRDIVHETLYCEKHRLEGPPTPRTNSDQQFVAAIRRRASCVPRDGAAEVVRAVVHHYVREISGHFDPRVYRVATRLLPPALSALLHGTRLRDPNVFNLANRVSIAGASDSFCRLARLGTVMLTPSHVSNLDSVILGWAISELGLRPFAYGAGLNLFSRPLLGFFMGNLGAYTVDRSKTDPLYRATLKEYATTLLEHGQHSLFFPGGTRSRSGAVEAKLKLGLLGTGVEALRRKAAALDPQSRIFVVPCTITYPLVLEAESLIKDFLRTEGGPAYFEGPDEFEHLPRWLELLRGLNRLNAQIHVRFGRAFDVIGNPVDDQGVSRDPSGRAIEAAAYLQVHGSVAADPARDAEYTRMLAARVVDEFRREVMALPTSVVAFCMFDLLRRTQSSHNLFRMLQALPDDASVPLGALQQRVEQALVQLEELESRGEIQRSSALKQPSAEVLTSALTTFSAYHRGSIIVRSGERVRLRSPDLLYYYQNRIAWHLRDQSRSSDLTSMHGGAA